MRKLTTKLLVGVLLLMLSAVVPHYVLATETTQALPKINEIYPNAPGYSELGFEFIELYNSGTTNLDLSVFQIKLKDKAGQLDLSGSLAGGEYKSFITPFALTNGGGTIQLLQMQSGQMVVIEEIAYGAGAAEDQSWSYFLEGWELTPVTSNNVNQRYAPEPVDLCPLTPEMDTELPVGYELNIDGDCVESVLSPIQCDNSVRINEFVSDPVGLEADGGEFIELYNPGTEDAYLLGCHVKSSKSSAQLAVFTTEDIIPPGGYFVISTTDKLTNASGSITFSSASSDDIVSYSNVHEGESFSYFADGWKITDSLTPNAVNQYHLKDEELADVSAGADTAILAPCPAGKYRNPETNRCRTIELADAELAPCDEGETRNPETNRCRKITLATATLAACPAGQERNPSTNRCRKIAGTSDDTKPCEDGYERNPETNRCRKLATAKGVVAGAATTSPSTSRLDLRIILVVLALAVGYGIYEYRTDMTNLYKKVSAKIAKK
ncbi:MAG TPA: lamin tail domain-containing protein [Candidatus Saccharibacteria bacterium]|jgi:hypothetical protein|nr:hypothetical protein [Patescibacteria group bacterium]HMS31443.1 lamin tail domain-containing protein [Candidatus Saccharibacteria bacterium]